MAAHDGAHGCHSSWIEFDEGTGQLKSYLGQSRDIHELYREPGKITLHSTGFYRRDALARIRYDESLTLGSDHQLQMRMTLAGLEIPHTGKFHGLKRLHAASVTSTGTEIQRDVADRTNAAYKFVLGEPFLAAVKASKSDRPWVTGVPTKFEMLSYLPPEFGAFHIDLAMEAALALGFDPLFSGPGVATFDGLKFAPAFQGYGYDTRLVMRSSDPMTAGLAASKLPGLAELQGVDIVAAAELQAQPSFVSLEDLRVEKGQRQVISRCYSQMPDAISAIPMRLLQAAPGQLSFFAVNSPETGVHVMLGAFDNPADLEYALTYVNTAGSNDFFAVTNRGKRGGFHGA
jgi:hypothetical protein